MCRSADLHHKVLLLLSWYPTGSDHVGSWFILPALTVCYQRQQASRVCLATFEYCTLSLARNFGLGLRLDNGRTKLTLPQKVKTIPRYKTHREQHSLSFPRSGKGCHPRPDRRRRGHGRRDGDGFDRGRRNCCRNAELVEELHNAGTRHPGGTQAGGGEQS